jgi:hypothetical protein
MTLSFLRRLLTPIGLTMALMFMAVGVALLYQYHSKFSVLEMVYNVVVFFFFMPTLCLWERRKPVVSSEVSHSKPF